ncbi:hypothetical protein E2562_007899 [Oryza meyeriana var. granulata]|uniref:Uncharacterized protein n=1 Tax=Oryza meyeriana var. granulata TaxID=110450 RepID=A0A6G1DUU0_9ORYZ|nr:hypothetical protein E2562_011867 [Oryza meyeriana var. granulata]KAF0916615.1 hypothetical protein E2562_007899 [Oryza meyeriana var. granulata]
MPVRLVKTGRQSQRNPAQQSWTSPASLVKIEPAQQMLAHPRQSGHLSVHQHVQEHAAVHWPAV